MEHPTRGRRRIPGATAVVVGSVLAVSASAARDTPRHPAPPNGRAADGTTVLLLGTGMPRPDPQASGPATAVLVGARVFLFDAGPGVMRQIAAAGLPLQGVTALFVTHLHSDHTLGYPDLIFTSWVMGRRRALEAYGPRGLAPMTAHLLAAWREDEAVRSEGLEHEPPEGYAVHVHAVQPGVVYDSGGVRVTAIPVLHGSWKEAYGYRVDTPTRSVVISGDTRPAAALQRAAAGVDVLVHEVYPGARLAAETRPGAGGWPRYMRAFHTSDVELGTFAAAARPRLLVLTHLIRMGADDEELLRGVRAGGFAGRVVVGHDLDRY
ncbi:ribonuclease Z [Gemmatimonadetes bacterium T265]|nr:ribonuclease Z [Gemmatimonadetes bacterium T265]